MTHYVRTTSSTDAQSCDSEEGAIKQVQINIARQKTFGREVARDGEKIIFREKTGELFDVTWAEDDDGSPFTCRCTNAPVRRTFMCMLGP